MSTTKKQHVPSAGEGQGLRSTAECGRWASWGTGDHEALRRAACAAWRSGVVDGWCKRCLDRAAVRYGWEWQRRERSGQGVSR